MSNRKGSILILAYCVLFALVTFCGVFFSRAVYDRKLLDISRERSEAFYLAEAGVDRTIAELNSNYSYTGTGVAAQGRGEYETTVTTLSSTRKQITSYGYIPTKTGVRVRRGVEAITTKANSNNFYDYAIYAAEDIDFNGNSYAVNGDIIYADTVDNPGNVSGTLTQDATITPLAQFDFSALRTIAAAQGNLYDSARLDDIQQNQDSYPSAAGCSNCTVSAACSSGAGVGQSDCMFWYQYPTNPADPTTGVPNVVYVEGDMTLNGNIGILGGFFLVVGNVLTDPDSDPDTEINGNGTVNGSIYTLGDFRINGGGGPSNLTINGGVWSGDESRLNGNATITYNSGFMDAIEFYLNANNAGIGSVVQLFSWREL